MWPSWRTRRKREMASKQWVRQVVSVLVQNLGRSKAEALLLAVIGVKEIPTPAIQRALTYLLAELRK